MKTLKENMKKSLKAVRENQSFKPSVLNDIPSNNSLEHKDTNVSVAKKTCIKPGRKKVGPKSKIRRKSKVCTVIFMVCLCPQFFIFMFHREGVLK